MFQRGVLRTNCIDCLDRTNVAQYAYGLAALGHQLHALGIIDHLKMDLDDPVSDDLMGFYERMGDTLAHQYGGSAAHNKVITYVMMFFAIASVSSYNLSRELTFQNLSNKAFINFVTGFKLFKRQDHC